MIVLVHGPDAAMARDAVRDVVRAHDPEGANTSVFDGKETALGQIVAAAGSAGFFSTGRVVVVHDLMTRARGGKATSDDGDGAEPVGAIDLGPLFAAVPPENLLVLVDPALASIPAAVKKAAGKEARIVAGEPLRGRELIGWVVRTATEAGGEFDPAAAKLLVETLYPQTWTARPSNPRFDRPPNHDLLRARVETLVLFAHPERVGVNHVRSMVEGAPDDRIFAFVEAAAGGDLRTAAAQLEQLLMAGEEPAKLLAQVFGQVELGMVVAAGAGLDPAEIGREVGLSNPAQMTAIARGARSSRVPAEARIAAALATERGFKTGRLRQPTDALLALIARLTASERPGANGDRAVGRGSR